MLAGLRLSRNLCIGVVLAIVVAAALWMRKGVIYWVRRNHVVGIDVSHHQNRIDWAKVSRAGVSFAFIKATEGATFTDPLFATNWLQARASGVLTGAYHYFTFCSGGREQAAHFLKVVPVEVDTLPPLVDLEFEGNCSKRPSLDQLKTQLDDFRRIVESHHRRKVIFYATEEFYAAYGVVTRERELFVRELYTQPRWLEGRAWSFWQFDDAGRIDGVEGAIDFDAFHGSMEELRALTQFGL